MFCCVKETFWSLELCICTYHLHQFIMEAKSTCLCNECHFIIQVITLIPSRIRRTPVRYPWKPHLEELVRRAVVDGGRRRVRRLIVAPLQLAETVDAVKVAGVQLGEVDVREVSVQAVRTHLLLPILQDGRRERQKVTLVNPR